MPTQNLVQIQRDLQGLPPGPQTMMYLKRAKDGMVTTVPPYLAAAELSSREKMAQRQALSQGAAQGEMPTVSEQLSQKADLLALQAMKKREMDAQSANQARTASMPAPEGAPEPDQQPQSEGGLPQIPVEFGFEGGGLVAFNGETGSAVRSPSIYEASRDPLVQSMRKSQPSAQDIASMDPYVDEDGNPRPKSETQAILAAKAQLKGTQSNTAEYQKLLAQKQAMAQSAAYPKEAVSRMEEFYPIDRAWTKKLDLPATGAAVAPGQASAAPAQPKPTPQQIEAMAKQGAPAPSAPPAPPKQGLPAALQQTAAAPTEGIGAVERELMARLGLGGQGAGAPRASTEGVAPSITQSAADVRAAMGQFGLNTPAGAEERKLIDEMRARHAQQQKDRDRLGLQAVLAGFGRGYGGAAAANIEQANKAYSEDMAHQKAMYDLINAVNKGNRGEAEKAFEKTMGLQGDREKERGAMSRTELQAMATTYGNLLQAGSSKYNADAHVKVALLNAQSAGRDPDIAKRKLAIDALQSAEKGVQSEINKLQNVYDKASRARKAQLENDLNQLRAQIQALAPTIPGVQMPTAAPPAAAPGNRPPLSSFQR